MKQYKIYSINHRGLFIAESFEAAVEQYNKSGIPGNINEMVEYKDTVYFPKEIIDAMSKPDKEESKGPLVYCGLHDREYDLFKDGECSYCKEENK